MSDVLPEKQLMGRRWKLSRGFVFSIDSIRLMFFYQSNTYILEIYKTYKRIYLSIIPIY